MTPRNGEDGTALILPPKPRPVSVAASLRTLSIFAGSVAFALVVHLMVARNEPLIATSANAPVDAASQPAAAVAQTVRDVVAKRAKITPRYPVFLLVHWS